jgi:uncharacterized membrane protein YqgA involved in biofilm formation
LVPVIVTTGANVEVAITGKKTMAVDEGLLDVGVTGVTVAVSVGVGVSVAGVTMAVWVWKKYAANVPTPAVRLALISGVSATVGAQEAARTTTRINTNRERFETFIFTSIGDCC